MAARGVNKVILVGHLGQDPDVRYMPNGGAVANLTLATSETWRDKQSGELRENTEWHRVVMFGKLAEVAGEYPWYTGNILFAFAVTGQVLRWVSQPSWYYTLPAAGLLVIWIPLSTASYGMAGVGMLAASWLLCRAQHAPERLVYGVLWALMVLLMNMHDVSESVAGLAIALLTLMVCSSSGERVKRFWPRHFFAMFYAVHLAVLGIVVSM